MHGFILKNESDTMLISNGQTDATDAATPLKNKQSNFHIKINSINPMSLASTYRKGLSTQP